MAFQTKVDREYTPGFVGDMVFDGPYRAKPGRIVSDSVQDDGSTNRIGRVFGYVAESGTPGQIDYDADGKPKGANLADTFGLAASVPNVEVGGTTFFGILGHPYHYVNYGTPQGGALAPTTDLKYGSEGEFFDMVTGLVVDVVNSTTSPLTVGYGQKLAYVPKGIDAGNNTLKLAIGTIIAYTGDTVPTGMLAIPNTFVRNPVTIPASADADNVMSAATVIQMTN